MSYSHEGVRGHRQKIRRRLAGQLGNRNGSNGTEVVEAGEQKLARRGWEERKGIHT